MTDDQRILVDASAKMIADTCPLEKVREQNDKVFFQVYLMGGREATKRAFARARALGYRGLFVTIDTAVAGMRERDHRNGMGPLMAKSLLGKLPYLPEILAHPRWLARFLVDGGMPGLPNVVTDTGPLVATGFVQVAVDSKFWAPRFTLDQTLADTLDSRRNSDSAAQSVR